MADGAIRSFRATRNAFYGVSFRIMQSAVKQSRAEPGRAESKRMAGHGRATPRRTAQSKPCSATRDAQVDRMHQIDGKNLPIYTCRRKYTSE